MIIKPFFYLSIIRISIRLSQQINICSWNVCHYKVVFQCCLFVVYFDIRVSQIPLLNFFLRLIGRRWKAPSPLFLFLISLKSWSESANLWRISEINCWNFSSLSILGADDLASIRATFSLMRTTHSQAFIPSVDCTNSSSSMRKISSSKKGEFHEWFYEPHITN